MDTLIFLLILGTTLFILRTGDRARTLALFGLSLVVTLVLFKHHVTSSLDLNF